MELTTKCISVDQGTRACINCGWYNQYFREDGDGPSPNTSMLVAISKGYCALHQTERGALRQPCRDYRPDVKTPSAMRRRGRTEMQKAPCQV